MNEYYKNVYSQFWMKQTKIYGIGEYEKIIITEILKCNPDTVFEVGIGTGWPIASMLRQKRKDILINGCDIAEMLVDEAKRTLNVNDGIWTGDIANLNISQKYDVCYCVRSSWYIPDFYKKIEKMIDITKSGGYIIFDIMDDRSLYYYKQQNVRFQNRLFNWVGIEVDEAPSLKFYSCKKVRRLLKKKGITYECFGERDITSNKDYFNTPKKLYVCQVERGRK